MRSFSPLSTSDQLAEHLREEILSGRISGVMPGISQLVKALGVNSVSATKAVQQLERKGLVISQGDRRRRLIAGHAELPKHSMRVGILYYDPHNIYRADALQLRQAIADSAHLPVVAPKTMQDLGMDLKRIIRHIQSIEADAWIVNAGPSEVLQWFAQQDLPTFAVYGRLMSGKLAGMGIRKTLVMKSLVERLVGFGHRRIVMLAREERRKPTFGLPERFFLEQLEAHGIQTGSYNIPDWEESPEGLQRSLDQLFRHTPPTALIVCDPATLHAVHSHLARNGINAPEDYSLFCNDYVESLDWCLPRIAHLKWDSRPTIRRVMQWVDNISKGKVDRKLSFTRARYVDGDTVGPAPCSSRR